MRLALLLGVCPLGFVAIAGAAQAQDATTTASTTKKPAHVVHHAKKHAAAVHAAPVAAAGTTAAVAAPAPAMMMAGPRRRAAVAPIDSSESVIVTGSRVARKARDSTTPVDVISAQSLERTGSPNLTAALALTNASIEIKAIGSDTSALTSSIRLRGLSPNETLVLLDGKRRISTANISADAGPEGGSSPVDLNMIPAAAIDHIEVLRDGAAAQYGSDAIAGVVNIILKKNNKGSISFLTGANAYNGDGWTYQVDADKGFYFGNDGYVHVSFQSYHADHFVPKTADDRAAANGFPADQNMIASTPEETRQTASLAWGTTIAPDVFGGLQTYGNVTYGRRYGESYENYRVPSRGPEYFPYGFSPLETVFENTYAATVGLKAPDVLGFHVDVSSTWGQDDVHIGNKNTVNPTLYNPVGSTPAITAANYAAIGAYGFSGGYSPTIVQAQTMTSSQWTNNIDVTRNVHVFKMPVTIAFGGEERMDEYQLGAGDPASWLVGGTQGFAGLTPASAGTWYRDVWAAYGDIDMHPLKQWDLDFAGRYEHYTDADDTFTGKVSTRYDFNKFVAIRGTVGNGFQAPTLAEDHFSALNVSPTGASGSLATDSAAAKSIGAVPLKPERSFNMSAGIVLQPMRDMSVTVDVYQINIRDRIVYAGGVNGQQAVDAIELTGTALPVFDASTLNDVSAIYFANGASTRTQGLDLNWNYLTRFGRWGTVNWSADLDLNRTRLTHAGTDAFGNSLVNAQTESWLTTASPRSKLILDAYWKVGKYDVNVRQTRWGETKTEETYEDQAPAALQYSNVYFGQFVNTPRWTTDLEVGYQMTRALHLAIGGNNLFNIRPRELPPELNYLGANIYSESSAQVPITGGFYYGRINYTF